MALRKVKGNIDRLFDKSLSDLVRGIRNNRDNEPKYIAECLEEIKIELKHDNGYVKSNAIAKLTYLQMLGYNIAWANFNIIEVMSSNRFTFKRIGYLAASQTFHPNCDLLMLTTNLLRKEITSQNQYEASLALNALSCFLNADLGSDLFNDILNLLNSTKPYIRKKAILVLYKVFLKCPETIKISLFRLKEKLDDADVGVQSAAINVIFELSRQNPRNFLDLSPIFFNLMTTSTNNWMLIKIIKLFRTLIPLEPKIAKKLIEPLTNLINSTSATSLLYECVNTVMCVLTTDTNNSFNRTALVEVCVQKLKTLIEDSDQNLKYLGLLALSRLVEHQPRHIVLPHRERIINCLSDNDDSIRMRALDLLPAIVSKKTLMNVVASLMEHMENLSNTAIYRDRLLKKIIEICSQSNYEYIANFEWYITILIELSQTESGQRYSSLIVDQLFDITVRVPVIRLFIVGEMADLLINNRNISNMDVLKAAAWICGEFRTYLKDPETVLNVMLKYTNIAPEIQQIFLMNELKIFVFLIKEFYEDQKIDQILQLCDSMEKKLVIYVSSLDDEVQERSILSLSIVNNVKNKCQNESVETMKLIIDSLNGLFADEMNPVAPKAQKKVAIPEGLNLDEWINEPFEMDDKLIDSPDGIFDDLFVRSDDLQTVSNDDNSDIEVAKVAESTNIRAANISDPNYLSTIDTIDSNSPIKVKQLEIDVPLMVYGKRRSDRFLNKDNYSNINESDIVISTELEMPEGYELSESPKCIRGDDNDVYDHVDNIRTLVEDSTDNDVVKKKKKDKKDKNNRKKDGKKGHKKKSKNNGFRVDRGNEVCNFEGNFISFKQDKKVLISIL